MGSGWGGRKWGEQAPGRKRELGLVSKVKNKKTKKTLFSKIKENKVRDENSGHCLIVCAFVIRRRSHQSTH